MTYGSRPIPNMVDERDFDFAKTSAKFAVETCTEDSRGSSVLIRSHSHDKSPFAAEVRSFVERAPGPEEEPPLEESKRELTGTGATNDEIHRRSWGGGGGGGEGGGGGGGEGAGGDSNGGDSGGIEAAWDRPEPPGDPFTTPLELSPHIELPTVQVASIGSHIEDLAVNYLCGQYMSTYGSLLPGGCDIFRKQDPNASPPSPRPPTQLQPQPQPQPPNPKTPPAVPPPPPRPTPRLGKGGGGKPGQRPPVEV